MLRLLKFCFRFRQSGAILGTIVGILLVLGGLDPQAMAAQAMARATIAEVRVSLGNEAGELKFFPNQFKFTSGLTYVLILNNPSPEKHYFTSKDFADASWTRKLEAGNVEVKGAIHEVELKPGATAEWVFVPEKEGTYELECTIPGHAEAGMTGTIEIVEQ